MLKTRSNLRSPGALAFGYISSTNSAKLFSLAAPLLIGKAPGDRQLEQMLAASAGKILRGIAWSSESSAGGIEDRFLFSLEPSVVTRLQPAFDAANADDAFWKLVPETFQSLTIYRSEDAKAAWIAIDSAVASKLDALTSVLFASLLKSGLAVYGIADPQDFLPTLGPPLVTVRPDPAAEGSILIARVRDPQRLRQTLGKQMLGGRGQILEGVQSDPNPGKEFSAVLVDNYVLLGKTENVRRCLLAIRNNETVTVAEKLRHFTRFAPNSPAPILTFASDEPRLTSVISVLSTLKGTQLSGEKTMALNAAVKETGYSATETTLTPNGIERKTHSALGQFSTLLSLLGPNRPPDSIRER
jgi:hypothetical protein